MGTCASIFKSAFSTVKKPCYPGKPRLAQSLGHELPFEDLGLQGEADSAPVRR